MELLPIGTRVRATGLVNIDGVNPGDTGVIAAYWSPGNPERPSFPYLVDFDSRAGGRVTARYEIEAVQ